jgi:tRNA-dihydrouridine synthase
MKVRKHMVVLACIVLLLGIVAETHAAYFVFSKKGNIRSGPGTKYRVIGQLAKETIAEIPDTFTDYEAKWIAIDARTKPHNKTNSEKIIYTKWVHRSLGVVIKGDINEVDKYFAVKESGWPKKMQDLILQGKAEIGMSTHMVFYAWGRPDQVRETEISEENSEIWVYEKRGPKGQYLHFRDGILRNIRDQSLNK